MISNPLGLEELKIVFVGEVSFLTRLYSTADALVTQGTVAIQRTVRGGQRRGEKFL